MHYSIRSTTTVVKDQQSPTQWVEIIEPKSKEKMYANLQTGSCVWDAPEVNKLYFNSSKARSQKNLNEIIIIATVN